MQLKSGTENTLALGVQATCSKVDTGCDTLVSVKFDVEERGTVSILALAKLDLLTRALSPEMKCPN